MRRLIAVWALELYALAFAFLQSLGGVRTDEAKYLLDIPYPHPPLIRWILSQTELLPFQEMFWRIIFATLVVQAVWFIWHMGKACRNDVRLILCGIWLFSSSIILQAGTIMMAPLTAVQGLIFIFLLTDDQETNDEVRAFFIALLWFVSLFTAYQAVLFLPIVSALFWRMRIPLWQRVLYIGAPLLLLMLYTLGNPLALASMGLAAGKDVSLTLSERFSGFFWTWGIGGSFVLSLVGTVGIFWSRRWEIISSFLLVSAYVFLSRHEYYAILFMPLFVAGILGTECHPELVEGSIKKFLCVLRQAQHDVFMYVFFILFLISTLFIVVPSLFYPPANPARAVMRMIAEHGGSGEILISGPFGHEWQYESPFPVRKYHPEFLKDARAAICLRECEGIRKVKDWEKMEGVPVEVWVRK